MRKLVLIAFSLTLGLYSYSQEKKPAKKFNLSNRANDHVMLQFSTDFWTGDPDSISSHIEGFNRGFNFYLMYDKPFRGNPKISAAAGLGMSTSAIFFDRMFVDIGSTNLKLPFRAADTTIYFKKYKLNTSFLEIPIELRYSSSPEEPNKSLKFALGLKIGTMLKAYTKGKTLKDANGITINDKFIKKEQSKNHFNTTRMCATARFGYGIFGAFASYNLTPMFKGGVGPSDVKLWQIGIVISGL